MSITEFDYSQLAAEAVSVRSSGGTPAKMGDEGSLTGIFGVPGSGKGIAYCRVLFKLVDSGRVKRIVTNAPLVPERWKVPIVFKTNEEMALLRGEDLEPGDAVLVDEAHLVWEATQWQKVSEKTDVKDWVAQARHLGVHFIVVSQAFEEFVFFVRRKLTEAWMCWRVFGIRASRKFLVEGGKLQSAFGMPRFFLTWFPPRRACLACDSMARAGTGPGKLPKWKVQWWFFVLVVLLFSLGMAWSVKKIVQCVAPSAPVSSGVAASRPAGASGVSFVVPLAEGEKYDRRKMVFMDGAGVPVDPRTGLSSSGQADWGAEWDVVRSQISSSGRGISGDAAGQLQRNGAASRSGLRSNVGGILGRGNGRAGDSGAGSGATGGNNP